MKSIGSSVLIPILFLALSADCKAQDKPVITERPVTAVPSTRQNAKTDSLKIKKRAKRKREHADTVFYPYQPPAGVAKPLPYNSYREQPAPVKEGTGAGILKDILTNKKNN